MGSSNKNIRQLIKLNIESKQDFKVREVGTSVAIQLKRRTVRGTDFNSFVKGVHLAKAAIDNSRKRIQAGLYTPVNQDNDRCMVNTVCFDPYNIRKLVGRPVVAIDINSCYWNTAYQIGVIDKETHVKGFIKDKPYKKARNVAIGSLGTEIRVITYEKGEKVSDTWERRDLNCARLDVIDKVWEVANTIVSHIKQDFCMFLTDAFYVSKSKEDKVYELLKSYGYQAKSENVIFDNCFYNKGKMVYTVQYSKSEKDNIQIHFSKRNIVPWRQK